MIEFKRFVAARIADIEGQIGQLPDDQAHRGKVRDLRSDAVFYETALEVVDDYESERAFEHLQASRSLAARFERMGCRGGTP